MGDFLDRPSPATLRLGYPFCRVVLAIFEMLLNTFVSRGSEAKCRLPLLFWGLSALYSWVQLVAITLRRGSVRAGSLPLSEAPPKFSAKPTGARKNYYLRPKKRPSASASRRSLSFGIGERRSSAQSRG